MSRDRDFLAEMLMRQAPTPVARPLPQGQAQPVRAQPINLAQDENSLVQALQTQPTKVAGTVPLAELDARELLARNLLEQSNDRNAHPLARGLAAFMGAKTLQETGAERGKTQSAIATAEAEQKRLKRAEDLALEREGLDIKRAEGEVQREGLDVRREDIASRERLAAFDRDRQTRIDKVNAEERARKADIDQRRLELQERAAQNVISEKEFVKEQSKLDQQSALVEEEASASNSLQLIDDLLEHPGLNDAVGLSSALPTVPGGDAADFEARFDQIKGEAFLSAFQKLKGGGTITEQEGKKAESALARMQLNQSEGEFVKAAKEFKNIIQSGLDRKKAAAKKKGVETEVVGFEVINIRDE